MCLEHSGSQEDHPSRRKMCVIDDLSPNGYVVVVVFVVWDTVECVCMYTPHNARVQASR